MALTAEEYRRIVEVIPSVVRRRDAAIWAARVRALFQLMRWPGLAIMDALTLRRDELIHDEARGIYRVITPRTKTGTDVTVPIPPDVAQELLGVQNNNDIYFFWSSA